MCCVCLGRKVGLAQNPFYHTTSIQEKVNSSNTSIGFLENHLEKGTCPKTLRYNARANITPDEEFKQEIGVIRKKAEQALVGALVKFHRRRIERLTSKFRKLEQAKSRRSNIVKTQATWIDGRL